MRAAYGSGAQLARSLRNVIFSDGEKDPWKVGSIPDLGVHNGTNGVVKIMIQGAAHHEDLRFSDPRSSSSVSDAKALEKKIIAKWLGL